MEKFVTLLIPALVALVLVRLLLMPMKLIFKVGTQATALEAAELVGKKLGVLKSLSGGETASASASFLRHAPESSVGTGNSFSIGERQQEMYIVTPDEFKGLAKGECIMTYGGNQVYNLRIPMTVFDSDAQKRFGEFKVNRFRKSGLKIDKKQWQPAGFFENVDRYLAPTAARKAAKAAEDEDEMAAAHGRSKVEAVQKEKGRGYSRQTDATARQESA